MLREYLLYHPVKENLRVEAVALVPPIENRKAWDSVSEEYRQEVFQKAAEYAEKPYPMRKATDFLAFVRNGSRKADEDPYFFRRKKLCWAATACCLGKEKEYLDDVIDGIWCICEETGWVISAHNVNPIPGAPSAGDSPLPDPRKPYIDLFSAQTGMILALVTGMLRSSLDRVSPVICRRVEEEITGRIMKPFMEHDDFWWMGTIRKDLNNWTPWILSNLMVCVLMLPLSREERAAHLEKQCQIMDRWLDCVPEDGGCDEGAGYWNMAGGAMFDFLQMLEEATDGRMSFWENQKIRNILAFPAKVETGNGYFLNFADCDAKPFLSGERIQTAGEKTGNDELRNLGIRLRRNLSKDQGDDTGKEQISGLSSEMGDVPHFIRLIRAIFSPMGEIKDASPAGDTWLPDIQVRVVRREGMTLAVKGGNNGENHNHNDVGSFMLYIDGEPEIVDAGNMTYTAKTFSDERYTLWNVRSAYHNLPLIGGYEQLPGGEYRAKNVECQPNGLSLEPGSAYDPKAGIISFRREARIKDNRAGMMNNNIRGGAGTEAEGCGTADESCKLEISDENCGLEILDEIVLESEQHATWVFMFRNRPGIHESTLETERLKLEIPEGWSVEIEEIPVTDARMARNWPGSLWRVMIKDHLDIRHSARWLFELKR